jgi:DNA-binding response OmpR family regulator
MRVLLVDDEQELVSTLAERLALRGIEADWVATADNALKVVESEAEEKNAEETPQYEIYLYDRARLRS